MRIAVTGASGFVGRHLIRAGVAAGHEMVGLVRSPAARDAIAAVGGAGAIYETLLDPRVGAALSGVQAVVHLAQISGERGGATYEAVNVEGTRALLDKCRRAGVERIILFSGLGVARYGIAPFSTNGYFLSKLTAELEAFRSGLQTIAFRPSYIVGRGDALISVLLDDFSRGEVEIVGDGRYRLQPVAIADAVAAVLEASAKPGPLVYDLVGPEPIAWIDFVRRALRVAQSKGRRAEIRFTHIPIDAARAQAAQGGYRGLLPDEVDVVLCDEVSEPGRLEGLIGRPLARLDEALEAAIERQAR